MRIQHFVVDFFFRSSQTNQLDSEQNIIRIALIDSLMNRQFGIFS